MRLPTPDRVNYASTSSPEGFSVEGPGRSARPDLFPVSRGYPEAVVAGLDEAFAYRSVPAWSEDPTAPVPMPFGGLADESAHPAALPAFHSAAPERFVVKSLWMTTTVGDLALLRALLGPFFQRTDMKMHPAASRVNKNIA